jgi:Protein of unknown function (DUF2628)
MRSEEDLFSDFFQQDAPYYIDKVIRYRADEKFTFNVWAFFFGIFWFLYRRLYLEAGIIIVILAAISLFENLFLVKLVSPQAFTQIGLSINISVAFVQSMLANFLYVRKAERVVIESDASSNNEAVVQRLIVSKGGVSLVLPLLIAAVLLGALYFLRQP